MQSYTAQADALVQATWPLQVFELQFDLLLGESLGEHDLLPNVLHDPGNVLCITARCKSTVPVKPACAGYSCRTTYDNALPPFAEAQLQ